MQQYTSQKNKKQKSSKSPTSHKNNTSSIKSHFQKQTKQTSNNKSDGDGDDGDDNTAKQNGDDGDDVTTNGDDGDNNTTKQNEGNELASSNDVAHTKARNDIIAKVNYVKSTPFEDRLKACVPPAGQSKGILHYKKKVYSYPLLRQHLTDSEYMTVTEYNDRNDVVNYDDSSEDDKDEDLILAKSVADMDKELINIDDNSDEGTSESDDDDSTSDIDIEEKKPAATMEIEMGAGVTKAKTIVLPKSIKTKKNR